MRTTELTAVSILKGEIIVQMGEYLSQSVAFQSVRNHVRGEPAAKDGQTETIAQQELPQV